MIAKEAQLAERRPVSLVTHDTTPVSLDDRLRKVETDLIRWALRVSGGNKSKAAELLKIKRSTLGDRINRCGLGRGEGQRVAHDADSGATA